MIVDERVRDYIHSLEPEQGCLEEEIAREAEAGNIPIIKKETAAMLKTLVTAKKPGAILEVGTAVDSARKLEGFDFPVVNLA